MSFVSRGFRRRESADAPANRVPPGQYVTRDFPVLSAWPTPRIGLDEWRFEIIGQLDQPRGWSRQEFTALPTDQITVDIHCVTKWSKLDTKWRGVPLDALPTCPRSQIPAGELSTRDPNTGRSTR